jgi:transcriptional regulator with XRE-family HTH domain
MEGILRRATYEGDRQLRRAAVRVGEDFRQLRLRAGVSQAAVARAIGVERSVICRLEAGCPSVSPRIRARAAAVVGADFRMSVYADASPLLADAAQARIVELLLATRHSTWRASVEAPVPGPGRRCSDVRLDRGRDVVLVEVETRVRRWEELLRELHDKRAAVASGLSDRHCHVLLVLPWTGHHRQLVATHPATVRATFPAPGAALLAALTDGETTWPGDGLLWSVMSGVPRLRAG